MRGSVSRRRARACGRRHLRVRAKVNGTAERPRLVVFRSLKHIYAQLVDDVAKRTLMTVGDAGLTGKKTEKSVEVGKARGREGEGGGDCEGRVRPRGLPVSRPREGGGRWRPRGRAGVLKWLNESGGGAPGWARPQWSVVLAARAAPVAGRGGPGGGRGGPGGGPGPGGPGGRGPGRRRTRWRPWP
jgi:large subunit ribosomal protein L18